MKPNLLLVGFQKCGSSYLFDLLTQHPNITGTTPKETFYLTDKGYENYNFFKNISNKATSWSSFFPKEKFNTKYYLEASVCNFYQQNAIEYVIKNPQVKVLFILRNPVDRFISNFKYYKGNIPKLEKSITIEEYYGKIKEGIYNEDSLKFSIEHGKYHKYINKWEELIGKDRILLLSFKKLINNPNAEMKSIYDFLELEYTINTNLSQKKVNASREVKFRWMHKKLQTLFTKDFPFKKKIKKLYYLLCTTKKDVIISDEFKKKLSNEYKKEFEKFQNLL